MIRMMRAWFALLLLLSWSAVRAQQATESPAEPARARLAQLALDAPDLEIFVNGERYDPGGLFPAGLVSTFEAFPAGTYSLAMAPEGAGLKGAVVGPTDLTLEAGHVYTVAVVGQLADKDMQFLVVD